MQRITYGRIKAMATFRDFKPFNTDRSAEDRRRHRHLVEDSIKKNLPDIIAEEGIIGGNGNKKFKVPIRGLKEYQFIYGKNSPSIASGDGTEKRGDKVGEDSSNQIEGKGNNGAGNSEGEDIYETELTIEEIVDYLFEDLDLPYLDKKRFSEVVTDHSRKKSGYQRKGIPPRLAKKRTVIQKLMRKQSMKRLLKEEGIEEDIGRFPFKEDDIRYHRIKETKRKESNAVIICIMDTSGSMDITRKYLARSFYFLLYQFVKMKYVNVEVVFISHSTVAKLVTEKEFFHKVESGGTYISSGYEMALHVIKEKYNPKRWNIYAFHASDGDNWSEDNEKAIETANELCHLCNMFGYIEIMPYFFNGTIQKLLLERVQHERFVTQSILRKEEVWQVFKNILKMDIKEG